MTAHIPVHTEPTMIPFFATKTPNRTITVKTGVKAGASEQRCKLNEEATK